MPRGAKPGERRGGRKPGTPNKTTLAIRDVAKKHGGDAIKTLVAIMSSDDCPPAARVTAAKELLDRGYGKPSTVLTGDEDGGPIEIAQTIRLIGVRPDE